MEYGPAPESPAATIRWLEDHGRQFGLFINNRWVKPEGRKYVKSVSPCNKDQVLAETIQAEECDVDTAVRAAREAFVKWSKVTGFERARVMHNIARHLQVGPPLSFLPLHRKQQKQQQKTHRNTTNC